MSIALRRTLAAAAIALAAPLAPGYALAQESTNRVSTNSDWNVFVDKNPTECWAVSAPKETLNTRDGKPTTVRRGDILLFVNYQPGKAGQIAFTGGYAFAEGSKVAVKVDGKSFEMFADGEWAWPGSAQDDAAIMTAMKAGSSAILTAHSSRGTQTQDTFSLRGFTAAMNDASARCK